MGRMARTLASVLTPQSTKLVRRLGELNSKMPKKEARVPNREPVIKEKVEKRGKYLSAVVTAILNLQEELPWDNPSVTSRYVEMALKSGLDRNILLRQGNGGYKLSEGEMENHPDKVFSTKSKSRQPSIVTLLKNQ